MKEEEVFSQFGVIIHKGVRIGEWLIDENLVAVNVGVQMEKLSGSNSAAVLPQLADAIAHLIDFHMKVHGDERAIPSNEIKDILDHHMIPHDRKLWTDAEKVLIRLALP